jgi:predicted metal-dependent peptidase
MDGTQVTLEQKLVKAQLELKKKAPFISSMLATTNVVENYSIETAGVSLDTMYFNPNFMKDLSLKVIEFTYAHEMMHLLMQHRMRQGDRDHYLWNVACDAYINKMLANDLRLLTESEVTEQGFVMITDVDLKSDTPEIIYKGLEQMQQQMQQNPLQGDNSQGSGNSQRCGSDGSDGSSDSDEDGDENGQQSSDGQSGKGNKSSEGKGNSKSNGDEEGNDDGNEDGEGSGEGQDDGEKDGQGNSKGKGKKGKGQRKVKYKGKEVKNCDSDKISEDMVDDEKSQSMSDTTLKERSKAVVERAKVYNDTVGNRQVGSGEGGLLREVEKALAPKVNWFPLVRNRLTKATNTIYTYSSPDKRFLGRKMIMPGPKKLTEDALENVLIAIDTSGSISNKDLGQFFKMFESLIKKFKANGEVMYWGSEVEAVYKFNNWKELVKTKPVGGGGTDINCVYQYLEGRDFKIGKKKKPIMILVVTDGYFGNVEKKYEKWRKETVWLLAPDCYENFKEPFGTKAILKGEDEV